MTMNDEQKSQVLLRHPCFSELTSEDALVLAKNLSVQNFEIGVPIVNQGELVDSIYFLASGCAEVKVQIPLESEVTTKVVALLNEGEAIGLNESGLYSSTGIRTATVCPVNPVVTLKLDMQYLYEFLKERPHLNQTLNQNAELLWQMNLIKKSAPFAKLSLDGIKELAQKVKIKNYAQNEIIFQKGDKGDGCYLIKEGSVGIFIEKDLKETHIATLTSSMMFGEAAILLNLPRSASARASQNCSLFFLDRQVLLDVIKKEKRAEASFQSLVKLRTRPCRLPYVEIQTQDTPEGETLTTLKNPQTNSYYRIQEEGLFMWILMDGLHTLRELTIAFHKQYDHFDPSLISDFVMDLEQKGFIEKLVGGELTEEKNLTSLQKFFIVIKKVMEAKASYSKVDGWMTTSYTKFIHYFYKKPMLFLMSLFIILGFGSFLFHFCATKELFLTTPNSGWLLLAAYWCTMAMIPLHELAHGYTTKAAGKKVSSFGIGWFWMGPIAFCDTSDMWLATKRQRLAVDLAGIFLNALIAALASLGALFVTSPHWLIFLWLFAIYNYFMVFFNLDPILEFDGYYTLMDAFETNNLRENAALWLIKDLKNYFKTPSLFFKRNMFLTYWLLCGTFIACTLLVNYVFINVVLAGVFGKSNSYLGYGLIFFAVFMTLFSAWSNIKKKIAKM